MRLRYAAILIASFSSLAVAGAVVADGMPAKKAKAHHAAKVKTKKSTHAYGQGLHDESWDIANELNRQEWMRHRYGEDRDFGADGQEDDGGQDGGGFVRRERRHEFDGGRDYAMDHRRFGHHVPPPPPVDEEPLPPAADLPPPPVADAPPPRAKLPPAPHFDEPAPPPVDRYAERRGHGHHAEGGYRQQRRAEVRVYRDSHSASEERREAYVNGHGGGSVRGQVDGQGYGYSWGDGGYRGGGVERRGGGYAEQRFGYGRQSFESRTERFGGGYAQSGGYGYGRGGRYIPPYGVVEGGRYSGRDADGYLTWPGKR